MATDLRITVIGGGPVGLAFGLLAASAMGGRVRIRIFDHRWRDGGAGITWKGPAEANRRRHQVMTVQAAQYTLLPTHVFDRVFRPEVVAEIWPRGSDAGASLGPLNIRIADLEDGLLACARRCPQLELHSARFDVEGDLDQLRGEHLVVVCDGAGSATRDQLGIFGQPGIDAFTAHGQPIRDVVLGLEVRSRLPPPAAVLLTLAQNRFLLNPSASGHGFLNMRLTDEEATEVYGVAPGSIPAAAPCTQRQPCLPSHRPEPSPAGAKLFAPAQRGEHSALWARILDGLRLFDVDDDEVEAITSFELSMVQRPRFSAVLFHRTTTQPATIATLLGDAAISVHFWPGRGLNTGIAAAASLAASIAERWRGTSFRESDFVRFEGRMAQLQCRNQTRGFYGYMHVDDATGAVTPIKHRISRTHRAGPRSPDQHADDRAVIMDRLRHLAAKLEPRLPGGASVDLEGMARRLDAVSAETLHTLVASGPWDTYRPGGAEVDLDVERQRSSGGGEP